MGKGVQTSGPPVSPVTSDGPSMGEEALPHREGRCACRTIKPNAFATRKHFNIKALSTLS